MKIICFSKKITANLYNYYKNNGIFSKKIYAFAKIFIINFAKNF